MVYTAGGPKHDRYKWDEMGPPIIKMAENKWLTGVKFFDPTYRGAPCHSIYKWFLGPACTDMIALGLDDDAEWLNLVP